MVNRFSCIIIDDEPIARDIIEHFISNTPFLELKESFGNSHMALDYLYKNDIDIVFSDIEMPNMNGIQLVNSLSKQPIIIFITAHKDFAYDGFESGVTDYLVKPVSYERFLKAIYKAKALLESKLNNQTSIDHIYIKSDNKLIKITFNEIIYIEALKDYLKIYLSNGEKYITHSTMKAMEEKLTQDFFRIQRSFIINTKFIKSFYGNSVQLILGEPLPISSKNKSDLFQKLAIGNN